MAMRNPRLIVFSGAMAALALMSVLSAALGYTLPALLSRNLTQWLAAGLFLFFGFKMIKEAQAMSGDEVQHEMEEVTQQILDNEEAEKADKLGRLISCPLRSCTVSKPLNLPATHYRIGPWRCSSDAKVLEGHWTCFAKPFSVPSQPCLCPNFSLDICGRMG
jgi:putative Ca2+/H+ antiporter (TMEM165/GDT1 family)